MRIVFATGGDGDGDALLNELGAPADIRLMSYWYIKDMPKDFIEKYVTLGTYPRVKKQKRPRKPPKE